MREWPERLEPTLWGISRTSAHRAEAVKFTQFLTRKQAKFRAIHAEMPGRKEAYLEVPLVTRGIYP